MRLVLLGVLAVAATAACNRGPDRLPFEGQYFRATGKAIDRDNRADFEVVVRQASRSEDGARQAAAYEATRYCIRWFGRSDVAWEMPPSDEAVQIQDDQLIVRGTCTG